MKHTQGPWIAYGQMVCSKTAPRRTWGENNEYSGNFIVAQTALYTSTQPAEANANAKLIAKAPELLALVKAYLSAHDLAAMAGQLSKALDCGFAPDLMGRARDIVEELGQ